MSEVIRARIERGLKQEFNDIFPNMSEKLVEVISDIIYKEKAKYLNGIAAAVQSKIVGIELFGAIIDQFYIHSTKAIQNGVVFDIDQLKKDIEKEYGLVDDSVYVMTYKDVINGLYGQGNKDSVNTRIEKMFRNKGKILEYIQTKVYGG